MIQIDGFGCVTDYSMMTQPDYTFHWNSAELPLQWSEPLVDPDQYQIFDISTLQKKMISLYCHVRVRFVPPDIFHAIKCSTGSQLGIGLWKPAAGQAWKLPSGSASPGAQGSTTRHILSIRNAMGSQPTLVNDASPWWTTGRKHLCWIAMATAPCCKWGHATDRRLQFVCPGPQSFPKIFLLRWIWFSHVDYCNHQ